MHLAITVSALEDRSNSGFVIVIEDTSELLRAQKAAAWHEVARRIAHEIKNPLTPITLSAERILPPVGSPASCPPDAAPHPRECAETIVGEAQIGKESGGRVLAILPLPRRAARALRSQRSGGKRPRRFHGSLEDIDLRNASPPICRRSISIANSSSVWS